MNTERKRIYRIPLIIALLLNLLSTQGFGYAVGDYGSIASGAWLGGTTWGIWNGAAWVATATTPGAGNNVFILSGTTVTVPSPGPYACNNLTVEAPVATTKLWSTNLATPVFVYVYGSQILCDGRIGNGTTFDGISFAIEGATVTANGAGVWDSARIRKRTSVPNLTTNFIINTNINLRFVAASSTQIYNETVNTVFNVTVNASCTLTLVGSGGLGNACMNATAGTGGGGGSYTINGNMIIPGQLILHTNSANANCSFTINSGGYVRANTLDCNASTNSTQTFTINNGGTLEIDGTPTTFTAFSTTGNTYNIGVTSLVDYSAIGAQTVQHQFPAGYGHLRISGSLTKSLGGATLVRSNLTITNATGTPRLDVTASNFNLTVGGNWTNYAQTGFTEQLGRVIFSNHNSATSLNTTGGEVFYNLQMSKGSLHVMTMFSDALVNNVLTFSNPAGGLDLNGNTLTIASPLTTAITYLSTNGTGYIRSERTDNLSRVVWKINATTGAHMVPFGTGSSAPTLAANYIPFTYNLTSGNAGDVVLATYHTPPNNQPWPVSPITVLNLNSTTGLTPDNRDATVDRFWEIDHTGSPTTSYTFTYLTTELPISPFDVPSAIQAQRYDDPTDKWQAPLSGQTSGTVASTYYATVSSVSAASAPWTLSALASPLPIELIDFRAEGGCGQIEVKWSTATEKDNDHFILRRSADGDVFEDLVRMEGAGTSQQRLDYRFMDAAPLPGMNYYRLDQVDVDGTESQSAVIAARTLACGDITATVHPNPTTDQLSIVGLPVGKGLGVNIDLIDAQGRVLRNWLVADDRNRLDIDQLGVAPGGYLLRIVTNDRSQTVRVIVR